MTETKCWIIISVTIVFAIIAGYVCYVGGKDDCQKSYQEEKLEYVTRDEAYFELLRKEKIKNDSLISRNDYLTKDCQKIFDLYMEKAEENIKLKTKLKSW